ACAHGRDRIRSGRFRWHNDQARHATPHPTNCIDPDSATNYFTICGADTPVRQVWGGRPRPPESITWPESVLPPFGHPKPPAVHNPAVRHENDFPAGSADPTPPGFR